MGGRRVPKEGERLTQEEAYAIEQKAKGVSDEEIAKKLKISVKTLKSDWYFRIRAKLGVQSLNHAEIAAADKRVITVVLTSEQANLVKKSRVYLTQLEQRRIDLTAEGLSDEEIAKKLNVTKSAITQGNIRAVQKLEGITGEYVPARKLGVFRAIGKIIRGSKPKK